MCDLTQVAATAQDMARIEAEKTRIVAAHKHEQIRQSERSQLAILDDRAHLARLEDKRAHLVRLQRVSVASEEMWARCPRANKLWGSEESAGALRELVAATAGMHFRK